VAILDAVEERHAFAHELHQILVRGHDRDPSVLRRPRDEGRDDVVGFEVRHFQHADAVGAHQLADHGKLCRQIFRGRIAAGLVVGVEAVPEGLPRRVENDDGVIRLLLADHLAEHVDEAVGRVRRRAVRCTQAGNGEEGAIHGIRAVDEENARRGFRGTRCHAAEDTGGG